MAIARVFQAGAFVVHTSSGTVELTQAVAEDINNFNDAIASYLGGVYAIPVSEDINNFLDALGLFIPTLHFTEDINNFDDALGIVGLDYVLSLVDQIPGFVDALAAFYSSARTINENADNWLDALSTSFKGAAQLSPGEDISTNQGDALVFILGLEVRIGEQFTISDEDDKVLGSVISIAENTDNYLDDLSMGGLNELQLVLADSVNYFEDSVSPQYPRRNPTNRSSLTPYIRRYLNDVEVN